MKYVFIDYYYFCLFWLLDKYSRAIGKSQALRVFARTARETTHQLSRTLARHLLRRRVRVRVQGEEVRQVGRQFLRRTALNFFAAMGLKISNSDLLLKHSSSLVVPVFILIFFFYFKNSSKKTKKL